MKNQFKSISNEDTYRSSTVIAGEIYRVPNNTAKISLERFLSVINKQKKYKIGCYMYFRHWSEFYFLKFNKDKNTKDLLESFVNGVFIPAITQPIRITDMSATLIDNIYLKGLSFYQTCLVL